VKILLMGNPNVGKSVFFSRLTGVRVIASNYPGTTVKFTKGHLKVGGELTEVIDVPGTYTLEPTSKAEEVATEMLKDGDLVIDVVDATNLERNLFLTLQLLERDIPVVVALNIWDDTKHRGIHIDVKKLEQLLGVPVVPTVAVTGEGMKELVSRIHEAASPPVSYRTRDERWAGVGRIVEQVQTVTHRHHTWLERLGDASVKPFPGIPIAVLTILVSFIVVRFIGEGLIGYIFEPLFNNLWAPVMMRLSEFLGILESKRERFIVATLISIGVPCAALQAMVIGLVGREGWQYVAVVYGTLFVVWIVLGLLLNVIVKGFSPELLVEIPPYRLPPLRMVALKLWARILGFLREAVPVVMLGILVVTILYALNVFDYIANFAAPVVSGLFGLPSDATAALAIGFLRKDMAVGMLGALSLSANQLVVGSVVLAMFFPCIASFVVLARELGFKGMLAATGIMIAASLVVGSLLNLIL